MEIEARLMNSVLSNFRKLGLDEQLYMLSKLQKIHEEADARSVKSEES